MVIIEENVHYITEVEKEVDTPKDARQESRGPERASRNTEAMKL